MTDPFVGTLTFIRVYSGRLATGMAAWNPAKGKRERIGRLVQMRADKRDEIDEVLAGDIAAAVGLKLTTTGDTLCDEHHPIVLERMEFPEPVIDIAIEPKTKADQDKLGTSLPEAGDGGPVLPGADRSRERADADRRDGRAASGDHRRPAAARVQGRGQRRQAAGGVPGDHHPAGGGAGAVHPAVRGPRAVRRHRASGCRPTRAGKGFTSENSIVGGKVPKEFVEAAFQGAEESMSNGPLAGYPMVDVHVEAIDGSFHDVDSNEVAFRIAGSMAVREGAPRAGPVLLEPIMSIEVVTPEEFMGDVIGDLNARRGKVVGMEPKSGAQHIQGQVPLATMFGYATDLRSRTQGRATYTMQFSHYAAVPKPVADEIVARIRGH